MSEGKQREGGKENELYMDMSKVLLLALNGKTNKAKALR